MARFEIRFVRPDWEHPKDALGSYRALSDGVDWENDLQEWKHPLRQMEYPEQPKPREEDYMPRWSREEATYLMYYELVTEGTPVSPAFATGEELAQWLAVNSTHFHRELVISLAEWRDIVTFLEHEALPH